MKVKGRGSSVAVWLDPKTWGVMGSCFYLFEGLVTWGLDHFRHIRYNYPWLWLLKGFPCRIFNSLLVTDEISLLFCG